MKDKILKAIQGEIDPLVAYGEVKKELDELNEMFKGLKEVAIEEAAKYEKTFEHRGFKFECRSGRKTFNFKNINDWKVASENLKEIEGKYKAAYSNY